MARTLLRGRQTQGPDIDFPSADPGFVVDWLQDLAAVLCQPQSRRLPFRGWPEGRQAALVVTHDVDTAWILRRPAWLDRMVDLEARYGVRGAW